jgi:hypothetical protein
LKNENNENERSQNEKSGNEKSENEKSENEKSLDKMADAKDLVGRDSQRQEHEIGQEPPVYIDLNRC